MSLASLTCLIWASSTKGHLGGRGKWMQCENGVRTPFHTGSKHRDSSGDHHGREVLSSLENSRRIEKGWYTRDNRKTTLPRAGLVADGFASPRPILTRPPDQVPVFPFRIVRCCWRPAGLVSVPEHPRLWCKDAPSSGEGKSTLLTANSITGKIISVERKLVKLGKDCPMPSPVRRRQARELPRQERLL